jgi:paraquat-inducible protein A
MNKSSAKGPTTEPRLQECLGCGLFQTIPALPPGTKAYCARCPTILRRTSTHRLDHIVALSLTAFILLVVMGARRR